MDQLALFEDQLVATQLTCHYNGRGMYSLSVRRYHPGRGWALDEVYSELSRAELSDVVICTAEGLWRP